MAIELKEVSSRRDLKSFIFFPFWLYSKSKQWVPPLIAQEKAFFNRDKNLMFNTGDAKLFLVYKDRRIAGRVAVFANRAELASSSTIRFGFLNFENDKSVSKLLFEAIEEAARELKAATIQGPMGFTDLDKTGILIEGFNSLGSINNGYNDQHYQKHIEGWGFEKKVDFVDYNLNLQDADFGQFPYPVEIPQADLKASLGTKKELADFFTKTISPLNYLLPFIQKESITILKNASHEMVAFSVILPSFAKSIQRAKGHLTILTYLLFMLDKKQFKNGELHLHFANEASQKELAPFLISKAILFCKAKNIATLTSNPVLESSELENIWQNFGATQTKRKRVYSKSLSI